MIPFPFFFYLLSIFMFRAGSTVEVTLYFHPAVRWCLEFFVFIVLLFFCCKCFKVLNGCAIYLEIKK